MGVARDTTPRTRGRAGIQIHSIRCVGADSLTAGAWGGYLAGMSDERPSRADRDAARDVVRSALASGRIIQADHDQRIQAVDNAQTRNELAMVVTGLPGAVESSPAWREYDPPDARSGEVVSEPDPTPSMSAGGPPPPPSGGSAPYVPYGAPQVPSFSSSSSGLHAGSRVFGIIIAIVVLTTVLGAGVAIFIVARSGIGDSIGDAVGTPDMHSQSGLDDLIEAVEEEKGSTEVFSVALYAHYAIVRVPAEEGSQREDSFYFDGSLDDWTKSQSTSKTFDLEDINGDALDNLCEEARSLVEDPRDCYINISGSYIPGSNDPPTMTAYVSNEYGESASVVADLEGEIIEQP